MKEEKCSCGLDIWYSEHNQKQKQQCIPRTIAKRISEQRGDVPLFDVTK